MARQLAPHHEAQIDGMVESGHYTDAEQVIGEALRLLEERTRRIDNLRAMLSVGEEQEARGEIVDFTPELFEQIKQSARERARIGYTPNPDVCPSLDLSASDRLLV